MIDSLPEYVKNKLLFRNVHPSDSSLHIYSYTKTTQFKKNWDDVTLNARGLIVHHGQIISRGSAKFFNYGEISHPSLEQVVGVYEKVDGSLGIPYMWNNFLHMATKGSFVSEQADVGSELICQDEFLVNRVQFMLQVEKKTPIFEIIYPENRVVVDYANRRELIYIGNVDHETGLINYEEGREEFSQYMDVVKKYDSYENIPEKTEGFVVQFKDGQCAKIKSDWYSNLHRLTVDRDLYKDVLSSMIDDDLDWIKDVKEAEFAKELEDHQTGIKNRLVSDMGRLRGLFERLEQESTSDKSLAMKIQQYPEDRVFLFCMWRKGEKLMKKMLLQNYLLRYNQMLSTKAEEAFR